MNERRRAKVTYTAAQAVAMRDATVEYADFVRVAAEPVPEKHPRFFMDYEWVAWYEDTHPGTKVVTMDDLYEQTDYQWLWAATVERRKSDEPDVNRYGERIER